MNGDASRSVTAVIPTLGANPAFLERSVASVVEHAKCDVVLVDDTSDDSPPLKVAGSRGVRVVRTRGGAGFAGATQRGIDAATTRFVLLLNDDAWVVGGIDALVDAVSERDVAGAAPKVRFAQWPEVINSVGTVLRRDGWADSRGIGQPDVGQYDGSDRVFGLHFAAALVKRELFASSSVGPIDVSYHAYFEDIDWCLRANLAGFRFVSVPSAEAMHEQSATSRSRDFSFRFKLQQRNLVWTAIKCLERTAALRIVSRHSAILAWRAAKHDPLARGSVGALGEIAAGAPRCLRQRRRIQAGRVCSDAEIFALSDGERGWFDDVGGPVFAMGPLVSALRRRPDMRMVADAVETAARDGDDEGLRKAIAQAPPAAHSYLARLKTVLPGTIR